MPSLASLLFADAQPTPTSDLTLIRVSRRAMATTFEIAMPVGTPNAVAAAEDALDVISDLEDQLSIYRDDSEMTRLNALAHESAIPVEDGLFALLQTCARLTIETAGAFDAASGALVRAWGFYRREGRIPSPQQLAQARMVSGFRHVILDPRSRLVKYRQSGLEINLGGIGKGFALDRAAERLQSVWGIGSALLHGGQSSVYAIGTPPTDLLGWPISIRHPYHDDRTIGIIRLINQGLGTSAATFLYFEYKGKRYGHLLDPRTGVPAEGTASASCVAPTAAEADALSTAFFVAGNDWAAEYIRTRPYLTAIVLPESDAHRIDS